MENIINKTRDTNDCNKRRERIDLKYALKNHEVEVLINVKNAKGVIKIKTFKTTYLKEYVKSKFNKLIEMKPRKSPSIEKIFGFDSDIIWFNFNINCEKLISQLKIPSPIALIASEIR